MLENGPEIGQNGMHNFKLVQYNKAEIVPLKAPKKIFLEIARNSMRLATFATCFSTSKLNKIPALVFRWHLCPLFGYLVLKQINHCELQNKANCEFTNLSLFLKILVGRTGKNYNLCDHEKTPKRVV